MGPLFFVGVFAIFSGLGLFAVDRWSRGSMNSRFGSFQLPVWYLIIDAGFF